MRVEVVRLRLKGEKLPREAIKAAQRVIGELTVRSRLGPGKEVVFIAVLADDKRFEMLLPALDHVRLTRMSGDSFILFGIEEEGMTERVFKTFPQAWWCRAAHPEREPVQIIGSRQLDPSVMADLYPEQAES
ncbi:hypothetical protein [Rhizobacter fulvus]